MAKSSADAALGEATAVTPIAPDMAPVGGPIERLWMVFLPNGERHRMDQEPPEGIRQWARGLDATIIEYRAHAIIHRPPR